MSIKKDNEMMARLYTESVESVEMHETGEQNGATIYKIVIGGRYVALAALYNNTYTLVTQPSSNYPKLASEHGDPNEPLDPSLDGYQTRDVEELKSKISTAHSGAVRPMHNSEGSGNPGGY